MSATHDAAVFYASDFGWPVFPCKANKAPHTAHGFKDASTDLAQIDAWWVQWPDANIGLRCGPASGVWVVDIDEKDGKAGLAAWRALLGEHAPIETARVVTPSGGEHWYFSWTPEMSGYTANGQVAGHVALDTRTDGGYVLLPSSSTPEGQYVEDPGDNFGDDRPSGIAKPPAWLLGLLTPVVRMKAPIRHPVASGMVGKDSTSPADVFNSRVTWADILEPHGWRLIGESDAQGRWCRPGKEQGLSATTDYQGSECLYVFSSSTGFEARRGYSKFQAYALLDHGGDMSAATKYLMKGTG